MDISLCNDILVACTSLRITWHWILKCNSTHGNSHWLQWFLHLAFPYVPFWKMCTLNIPACTCISLHPHYHQSSCEIFQQIYLRIFLLSVDLYFENKERNQNETCTSLKERPLKTHPCFSEILTARTICLSCQEHKQRKKKNIKYIS